VLPVAAVHPHDRGLVAIVVGEDGRSAERLGPVGGESAVCWGWKPWLKAWLTTSSAITRRCHASARPSRPSSPPIAWYTLCIPLCWHARRRTEVRQAASRLARRPSMSGSRSTGATLTAWSRGSRSRRHPTAHQPALPTARRDHQGPRRRRPPARRSGTPAHRGSDRPAGPTGTTIRSGR